MNAYKPPLFSISIPLLLAFLPFQVHMLFQCNRCVVSVRDPCASADWVSAFCPSQVVRTNFSNGASSNTVKESPSTSPPPPVITTLVTISSSSPTPPSSPPTKPTPFLSAKLYSVSKTPFTPSSSVAKP